MRRRTICIDLAVVCLLITTLACNEIEVVEEPLCLSAESLEHVDRLRSSYPGVDFESFIETVRKRYPEAEIEINQYVGILVLDTLALELNGEKLHHKRWVYPKGVQKPHGPEAPWMDEYRKYLRATDKDINTEWPHHSLDEMKKLGDSLKKQGLRRTIDGRIIPQGPPSESGSILKGKSSPDSLTATIIQQSRQTLQNISYTPVSVGFQFDSCLNGAMWHYVSCKDWTFQGVVDRSNQQTGGQCVNPSSYQTDFMFFCSPGFPPYPNNAVAVTGQIHATWEEHEEDGLSGCETFPVPPLEYCSHACQRFSWTGGGDTGRLFGAILDMADWRYNTFEYHIYNTSGTTRFW